MSPTGPPSPVASATAFISLPAVLQVHVRIPHAGRPGHAALPPFSRRRLYSGATTAAVTMSENEVDIAGKAVDSKAKAAALARSRYLQRKRNKAMKEAGEGECLDGGEGGCYTQYDRTGILSTQERERETERDCLSCGNM